MKSHVPQIPLICTERRYEALREDIHTVVDQVLTKNIEAPGNPFVEIFERELATLGGRRYAISLGSGSIALTLALEALGIGQGDEVITTTFTYQATAAAIAKVGARPVFVDVMPDSLLMDPYCVDQAITIRTKAIVVVHLYGNFLFEIFTCENFLTPKFSKLRYLVKKC